MDLMVYCVTGGIDREMVEQEAEAGVNVDLCVLFNRTAAARRSKETANRRRKKGGARGEEKADGAQKQEAPDDDEDVENVDPEGSERVARRGRAAKQIALARIRRA